MTQTNKRKASSGGIDNNTGTPSSATPPPLRKLQNTTPKADEPIEDYADRILSSIFRITLDRNKTTDLHGHKLVFLEQLAADLESDGLPLKISIDRLDEAIMEAARQVPHSRPLFEYLLPCWKRVTRAIKSFRAGPNAHLAREKEALLKEARRLCFSNCIFALTIPDLFG